MVADSYDEADVSADERVEAEVGVELVALEMLLSMERRGFSGRPAVGVAGAGAGAAAGGAGAAGPVGAAVLVGS